MNKTQLIEDVKTKLDTSKKDAETIVNTVFESIMEGVKRDGKFDAINFIGIKSNYMKARPGRNPQTGDPVEIAAHYQLSATFGKGFKDYVNGRNGK
jgi:DNA-binding protein HU-beta